MNKSYLKIVYAFWATCYDKLINPLFKFDRAKVIKQLGIKKSDKILEVGLGFP